MKLLLALIAATLPISTFAAESCSGQLSLPGGFLNGNCTGSSCSAFLPSTYVSGSGYCTGGISVRVDGYRQGGFANGQCNGSTISLYLPGQSFRLNGTCSNGQRFSGDASSYGGFANGSCSESGGFNIFLPSEQVSFRGSCN
jgi:hypothetical protein